MHADRRTAQPDTPIAGDAALRLLIESVPDYAIVLLDGDGRIATWGRGAEAIHGCGADTVLGQPFWHFHDQDDVVAGLPAAELETARRQGRCEVEGWRRRADGSRFRASVLLVALRDGDGPHGFGMITRDVTDRHLSENMLREAIDSAIDAIVTIDARGIIASFHGGAERMFGYRAAEVIGRNVSMLMPDEQARAHDGYLQSYLATGNARIIGKGREVIGRRRDGSTFPLDLAVTEFTSRERHFFVGVLRDISERKRLEARLLQAQKLQAFGQMAGGVAHDFNNLLTVILGNTEHSLDRVQDSAEDAEPLLMVLEAGKQAAELTRQLLAFRRDSTQPPREICLNDVVTGSLRMLRRLVGSSIEVRPLLDDLLPPLLADANQLGQVLMNLAVNARDAMPEGGRLTIRTLATEIPSPPRPTDPPLAPGRYLLLAVTDTGNGISRSAQARLFEPFFTTKEPGRGNGLGLAIVFGIVGQAGGHVSVDSAPGAGSTFWIHLPVAPGNTDPCDESPGLTGTESIRLAIADPQLRQQVVAALGQLGYRPLAEVDDTEASLLLVDTDAAHREFAARQLQEQPGLRALFLGGRDIEIEVPPAPGRVACLTVPFAPLALAVKVRDLIEHAASR